MDRRWDKSKPPQGPFTLNRNCPQAQGLVAWWPVGPHGGANRVEDLAGAYVLTTGTAGSPSMLPSGRPAIKFSAASSQHLLNNTTPVTGWPLTISAWGATDGSTQSPIYIGGADVDNFCRIVLVSNAVRANCGTNTGPTQANAITTATYTNGREHLFSASFASNTSRTVYLDGGSAVSDTTSIGPDASFSRIRFGAALTVADAILQPWNGILGECAIWSRALSADEHMRLWSPATRYEMWYPLRSRKWFVQGGGGDVSVALTGQSASATAGTLGVTHSNAAAGQASTAVAGTLAPSLAIAIAGSASATSVGTLTPAATATLAGQQTAASAGTLAPTTTLGLAGQAASAAAGTVTPLGDVTVALSGQAITASAGTASPAITRAASGQSCAATAGTVLPAVSVNANGTQLATAAGTLTLGIVVPLAGLASTAAAGTVIYSTGSNVTVALSGQAVTASAGALTWGRGDGLSASPIGHGPAVSSRSPSLSSRRGANLSTRIR